MSAKIEAELDELRRDIALLTSRVMELALHQALLARLGKSASAGPKLQELEDDLIRKRARRDLLLFRQKAAGDQA
jgi:hypothetical protein